MSTAFTRALSPAVQSLVGATLATATISDQGDTDAALRLSRQTALQGAGSLEELIAMVPSDYREVLRPHILDVAGFATKRLNAYSTWHKWNAHYNGGDPKTFPAHILSKAPSIQLAKEYAQTEEGRSHATILERNHRDFCVAALKDSLTAKESEAKHLDGLLSPPSIWSRIKPKLTARIVELRASRQEPVFGPVVDGEDGEVTIVGWELSSATKQLSLQIQQDAVAFCFRAMAIVEGRHTAQRSREDRKKEIASAADVEMADATRPGPSIQSMIDRAVSARLNKAQPKRSNNAKPAAKGGKRDSARATKTARKASNGKEASREKRRRQVVDGNKRRFPPVAKPKRKGRDQHKGAKP